MSPSASIPYSLPEPAIPSDHRSPPEMLHSNWYSRSYDTHAHQMDHLHLGGCDAIRFLALQLQLRSPTNAVTDCFYAMFRFLSQLEDDHAENHYEDNRKHKLKHHKHIAHLFFIFRPRITLSTKHTTITKSEAAIYSNVSVYHGEEYDSYSFGKRLYS